jgi:hypothetical protein
MVYVKKPDNEDVKWYGTEILNDEGENYPV